MAPPRSIPTPQPILTAISDLKSALEKGGHPVDPLTGDWDAVERAVRAQLGGDFDASKAAHRRLSLQLGAALGERLRQGSGAFWFAQRDAVGALALGFPDAVFTVSPFSVAAMALIGRSVSGIGAASEKILGEYAAAKSAGERPARPLTPKDYHRFFDPAFIEFFVLDTVRANTAWAMNPGRLVGELKDAFFRAQGLRREAKGAVESEIIAPLQNLDASRPLLDQAEVAPRTVEQIGNLWGGVYGTGATTEEGWNEVAARFLLIGAPEKPQVTPAAITAAQNGKGPVTIFLLSMPKQAGAPDGGILGIFPERAVRPVHPKLAGAGLRLAAVDPSALLPLLQKYDAAAIRQSISRFQEALSQAAGKKVTASDQEQALLEEALGFLDKLRDTLATAIKNKQAFCLRRLTEAEASAAGKLGPLRSALRN